MSVNASRTLLEKFWIIKDREKELYYKTKESLEPAGKFARDYPGWRLINNERILKLEKIPAHAEPFMGITDFADKQDYVLFCALLIFLEDREDGEPFLLSELTDMMEAQLKPVMELDWTLFSLRRSLIRVMRFAEDQGLLLLHEGNVEAVSSDIRQEVLYENTGLSRFFPVTFTFDTSAYHTWQDYEREDITEADTDRGHFRINRVYRELLACPAMYWKNTEDPDSLYLKNQRQWVSKYLEDNLEGRLDIHRNAAFFVLDEENTYGEVFPGTAAIYDVVLLVCSLLRQKVGREMPEADLKRPAEEETGLIENEDFLFDQGETILMREDVFSGMVEQTAEKYRNAWSKEFREMTFPKLKYQVMDCMESWMLLRQEGDMIRIFPAALKFSGHYPKDFDPENAGETNEVIALKASGKERTSGHRRKKADKETKEQMEGQLSLF